MTSLPQVTPCALKPGTNSAGGISRTHDTEMVACRLYSRIAASSVSERAGADASTQANPASTNSNASDADAVPHTAKARPSEQGVGRLSCRPDVTHATFNPDAAPMARADSLKAEKAAEIRAEKRERLALNVLLVLIAAAFWASIFLPHHIEVVMPDSCFMTGC